MDGDQLKADFMKAREEYVIIKALYTVLRREVSERNRYWDELLEKGSISVEEWAEKTTDIEFDMGLDEVMEKLREAENRLLQAGKQLLETRISEEDRERIQAVWNCGYPFREKVVDTLLKWDPEQ
jgi:hypothetical protein